MLQEGITHLDSFASRKKKNFVQQNWQFRQNASVAMTKDLVKVGEIFLAWFE